MYVVHRDIKPGNVLIWSLGPERVDAKLADYGVSQFYTPGNGGLWGGGEDNSGLIIVPLDLLC